MTRLRSLLFVPGNQAKMLAKAESVAADAVVPDLEDSVPDAEKANARAMTASVLPRLAAKKPLVVPRVNSLGTPWLEDDLAAVVGPGVYGVSVGKIDEPDDIDEISTLLTRLERRAGLAVGSVKLIPWIETTKAIVHCYAICRASERIVAAAFGADLRDEEALRVMIDRANRHFGRLDALVNNAASWSPTPLETVGADNVRRFFEVNTISTFVCCQHAGLIMTAQEDGGAIVNIGDWASRRPYRDYSAYFISKGAIPTLTRAFAVELARKVRVNAVLPGPVLLPDSLSADERQRAIAGTLLGRAGRAENVAQAVAFLLANDFVSGVCLPVDGGRTIAGAD